ncbi:hypothetical protein LNN31_13825 [Acetobacterium wieringae]|uniref:Uncharacterized protein n=1 Tax=Acetobacterium wieringae TaxID=52694 RepID=A0ABY6HD37_9FIRM|nr:hypothetical protein [Acetobacterium wieringae]UYO61854.1 hypothetical protein LNN31_13825 [Acetobacterium wieringae]
MSKTRESSQPGDELRCSEIQKKTLAEFGIYTRAQLIEEFKKPFYTRAFTTPVSRNLTAMKEQAKREQENEEKTA